MSPIIVKGSVSYKTFGSLDNIRVPSLIKFKKSYFDNFPYLI